MSQVVLPKIECVDFKDNYGKFVAEPVAKGFGIILGNSLRRVLLSSLRGAAITSVLIEGITQEFSTMQGMKEDVTEFLLNLRDIRIKPLSKTSDSAKMSFKLVGNTEVHARDFSTINPPLFEIMNPDLYLATLDSTATKLNVEATVSIGSGYQPAASGDSVGIIVTSTGTSKEISIDAIFSPVTRVNYVIEASGPGQGAGKERLILEVWTDDTIDPIEAVEEAADILIEQLGCFKGLAKTIAEKEEVEIWQKSIPSDVFNLPLEKLSLSTHTYNSLRRSGITVAGQLLEKGMEGLMSLGGFGIKSREEVAFALKELGVELKAAGEIDKKKKTRAKSTDAEEID